MKNATCTFRLGQGAPSALREFIQRLGSSDNVTSFLRVQLGDKESFVVWASKAWACSDVPHPLRVQLCRLSSTSREYNGFMRGSLKNGTLDNVQWHRDGTFYVKSGGLHFWNYQAEIIRAAWKELWKRPGHERLGSTSLNELAVSDP